MTQERDERDLREAFATLREDVEAPGGVPDFTSMLETARLEAARKPDLQVVPGGADRARVTGRRTLGLWATLATAAAAAAILIVGDQADTADSDFEALVSAYAADAALGAWRSPTDGLLRTPGVGLGAVPRVGPVRRPPRGEGGPR